MYDAHTVPVHMKVWPTEELRSDISHTDVWEVYKNELQ